MARALCLLDAFHLTFTYGKPLWMLEPASVTTAQAQTCISRLGRRISLEWWMWWLQQQSGGCHSADTSLRIARVIKRRLNLHNEWLRQRGRGRRIFLLRRRIPIVQACTSVAIAYLTLPAEIFCLRSSQIRRRLAWEGHNPFL